jgi:DNA adenine methylase
MPPVRKRATYIESFIGGGSVIIELLKQCYIEGITNIKFNCYDINKILIRMFNEIKNEPNKLINNLKKFGNMKSEKDYYRIRSEYNIHPSVDKFIYLNKTGFRGIYQVNKKGELNTSFGHYKNPIIFNAENILELSKLFNHFNVTFEASDYRDIEIGDDCVLYLDPPYYQTSNRYSIDKFSHDEYVEYLNRVKNNSTISLIHSNSIMFRDIYETDENVEEIKLYNRINCKNPGQKRIELLFYK